MSYTHRSYEDVVVYGPSNTGTTSSNAFDAGFKLGAEVRASRKITIGADIRYLFNLSYRTENPLAYQMGPVLGEPLESLSYYFATINLKVSL